MIDLTTLALVRQYDPTIVAGVLDARVSALITAVSAEFEQFLDRKTKQESQTEYLSPRDDQTRFYLPATPITTITTLRYDTDRLFTDSADDIATTDYTYDADTGLLVIDGITLSAGQRTIKIVYTGGMATDTTAFIAAFPAVAMAADMTVSHLFAQPKDASVVGQSAEGVVLTSRPVVIPSYAKRILSAYKRRGFG